jgi:KipI family sensor histidine kinase inhibitor
MEPVFNTLGDNALLVTLDEEVSEETNDLVLAACSVLEALGLPGIEEVQPAYSSFCVHFDRTRVRASYIEGLVGEVLRQFAAERPMEARAAETLSHGVRSAPVPQRLVEIPVVYGGKEGPDLRWASETLGMSPEEVVRLHSSRDYRVYMLGFTPGFPYLGGMDERIAMPRLMEPRKSVPAGSVGIAGTQTGVYPWETPGGWRIIGRTPLELFSPEREDPSLIHPGDTVRFVPIEIDDRKWVIAQGPGTKTRRELAEDESAPRLESIPGFSVESPGFLTIVADEGRRKHRKLGVPVSGAADILSFRRANLICGNPPDSAALEMTLLGATLRAEASLTVSVAGAPAPVYLDGNLVDASRPVLVPKGSVLEVGSMMTGCRAYLAVSGGIGVDRVLGSASTYLKGRFGGFFGRPLKWGDVLRVGPSPEHTEIASGAQSGFEALPEQYGSVFAGTGDTVLPLLPGPEGDPSAIGALCGKTYTVRSESDRMGLRFDGPPLENGGGDILSSPVVPGTIQVPSDGRPLLLLADAQTTGGYRRVGVLKSEYLGVAGQLRPGARVRFVLAP